MAAILLSMSLVPRTIADVFNVPKSPEVGADGTVTFRVLAPKAKEVLLAGLPGKKVPLSKEKDGLWTVTAGPLEPGLYSYTFEIDGAAVADQFNRKVKAWRRMASLVEVPGNPPTIEQLRDVPHGEVHLHTYWSEALQEHRSYRVYTPPGYADNAESRAYPVLYLLHGSGDDESGWTAIGQANVIADNLIAEDKAKPMIIVMPHGHAAPPGVDMEAIEDRGEWYKLNNEAVFAELKERIQPQVEQRYRVAAAPDSRAVAGLSMGGGQAVALGLSDPERYHWVAGFSSAVPETEKAAAEMFPGIVEKGKEYGEAYRLIWIACGEDDFLLERNETFHGFLTSHGVEHQYLLTEGAHSWDVWRGYLAELLPLLFQS